MQFYFKRTIVGTYLGIRADCTTLHFAQRLLLPVRSRFCVGEVLPTLFRKRLCK